MAQSKFQKEKLKNKSFDKLSDKNKLIWLDSFLNSERDGEADPHPWDDKFGVESDPVVPGTDNQTTFDFFLNDMWSLREKIKNNVGTPKTPTFAEWKKNTELSGDITDAKLGGFQYGQEHMNLPTRPIGTSYPGGATQNPQKLNIMHNLDGPIGKPYGMDQGVQRSFTEPGLGYPNTDDSGRRLQSFKEGNTNFGSLRDMAVKKYNTDAFNNEGIYYDGDTNAFGTPMDTNFEGESNFGLLRDRAVDKFNVQPYENDYPYNKKVNSTGDKDTPKPKLDRLGNVIEDDSGFTGQDVKNWLTGVGDDIATFANDAGDYWNKTSLEDMGDDLIDAGADGIAWVANNPLEALSYGLMVIPGVGLVGGVALRTAIGAGKVVLSKPAKAAYKAVTSDKSRTGMYKAIEKVKTAFKAPPAQVYAQSGKGGGAMGNYNANIVARNKLINQKTKEAASKTAKNSNKTAVAPSTKYGPVNPLRPLGLVTNAAMKNPVKSFVAGAALNTAVTDPGNEFYNKFGDKKVVASELGNSINPTIDAVNSGMTQEQINSLPSTGQDWWTALEEQDAQQMQAIRDYEIRNAAQQNVKAKTALEDVPIDFSPFGPDFHQKKGTNVWTQFRNY